MTDSATFFESYSSPVPAMPYFSNLCAFTWASG
jgi:hypothetical protein